MSSSTEQQCFLANAPEKIETVSPPPTDASLPDNQSTRPTKRQLRFQRRQAKLRSKRKEERLKKRSARKRRLDKASAALLSTETESKILFL